MGEDLVMADDPMFIMEITYQTLTVLAWVGGIALYLLGGLVTVLVGVRLDGPNGDFAEGWPLGMVFWPLLAAGYFAYRMWKCGKNFFEWIGGVK